MKNLTSKEKIGKGLMPSLEDLQKIESVLDNLYEKAKDPTGYDERKKKIDILNEKIYDARHIALCEKCGGDGDIEISEDYTDWHGNLMVDVENCDACKGTGADIKECQEAIFSYRDQIKSLEKR